MTKITIMEDATPHWTPQKYGYGIDSTRIGKVVSQDWWKTATLKDVKMMNEDGPYLGIKYEEGTILDFAIKYAKNKEVVAFLKGFQNSENS